MQLALNESQFSGDTAGNTFGDTLNEIDAIVNISASPFTHNKHRNRFDAVQTLQKKISKPFLYVNQTGANDSLIFDGYSFVLNQGGEIISLAKGFATDRLVMEHKQLFSSSENNFDSSLCLYEKFEKKITPKKPIPPLCNTVSNTVDKVFSDLKEKQSVNKYAVCFEALVLGLKDYLGKNNFKEVVLGLSGGIDSALIATLAVAALGNEGKNKRVKVVAMPSPYNSPESLQDAKNLAKNLNISLDTIEIESIFKNYLSSLSPIFHNTQKDVTEENIQSRIRGTLLMAISNKFNSLLLNTGNKSELAVGYCTLYGDMNGCLSVIGDLYKTEVFALARWINDNTPFQIPENILTKEPSAELSPDQKDSDTLPPYEILDKILYLHLEKKSTVSEIKNKVGVKEELIIDIMQKVKNSEFKRYQSPPILKIAEKSFGEGRLIPLSRK